jgi:hypothetical protein
LFDETANGMRKIKDLPNFKGYHVSAIDGTTVPLENVPELIEYFHCSGSDGKACTARVSVLCDCINEILLDAEISDYKIGERQLAEKHIDKLISLGVDKDIVLFDRGYVSNKLIAKMSDSGIFFVMRLRDRWHENLVRQTAAGDFGQITYKNEKYDIRVIKLSVS